MSVAISLSSLLLFLNLQSTTVYTGNQKPSINKSCSLSNPGYAGVCVVIPAKGETCNSILKYLNNPMSAGKTYCSNTNIRGSWKLTQVLATSKKPGATRRKPGVTLKPE